ncbi:MAG TPA: hypothetical protein VLF09_03035 [Cellvibrio sp.]|nr:hypothetical protein [Cellvibrio sp.]
MKTLQITKRQLITNLFLFTLAALINGAISAHLISKGLYSSTAVIWMFFTWAAITITCPESTENMKDFHERFYKL